MIERLDALVVHGCRGPFREREMGNRNTLLAATAAAMYHSGEVGQIVVFGGHWWGRKKPTFAEVFSNEVHKRGVDAVIAVGKTRSTVGELKRFSRLAREEGWSTLGSLATADHQPRVGVLIDKKHSAAGISSLAAEGILRIAITEKRIQDTAVDEAGRLLEHFSNPDNTEVFRNKEEKLTKLTQHGFGWIIATVGGLPIIRRFQNAIDD